MCVCVIFTSEIIPTHRACLLTVCMKSLHASSACCSGELRHFSPSNRCVCYFLRCQRSKVLQTLILAHLKTRLSRIQTAVTILDLYPPVPEMDDGRLIFSHHPSSTF